MFGHCGLCNGKFRVFIIIISLCVSGGVFGLEGFKFLGGHQVVFVGVEFVLFGGDGVVHFEGALEDEHAGGKLAGVGGFGVDGIGEKDVDGIDGAVDAGEDFFGEGGGLGVREGRGGGRCHGRAPFAGIQVPGRRIEMANKFQCPPGRENLKNVKSETRNPKQCSNLRMFGTGCWRRRARWGGVHDGRSI